MSLEILLENQKKSNVEDFGMSIAKLFYEQNYLKSFFNMTYLPEDGSPKTRLQCMWSYEAIKDVKTQFNLDAECELRAILLQEINLDLTRRCLNEVRNKAKPVVFDFEKLEGNTLNEKAKSFRKLIDLEIDKTNPTWIITSPEILAIFNDLQPPTIDDYYFGIHLEGTLNNINYYKDYMMPSNQILMGNKNDTEYTQKTLISKVEVINADTGKVTNNIETNYEFKILNPDAFTRICFMNFLV